MFEGIRVYDTPNGPAVFRLTDHIRRLFDSAKIYGFQPPYTEAEIIQACKDVVAKNGLKSAYIRPVAFLGECGMGVIPKAQQRAGGCGHRRLPLGRLISARMAWRRAWTSASPPGSRHGAQHHPGRGEGGGQLSVQLS